MKCKIITKLVYTDTLFKFLCRKEEKMMKKAYKIGKQIRLLRLNQKKTAFYRNAVFMMPGDSVLEIEFMQTFE